MKRLKVNCLSASANDSSYILFFDFWVVLLHPKRWVLLAHPWCHYHCSPLKSSNQVSFLECCHLFWLLAFCRVSQRTNSSVMLLIESRVKEFLFLFCWDCSLWGQQLFSQSLLPSAKTRLVARKWGIHASDYLIFLCI